jgi:hypothetical protein
MTGMEAVFARLKSPSRRLTGGTEQRIIVVRMVGIPPCSLVDKYERFGRICVPRHGSRKATLVASALVTDLHGCHSKPIWKYILNLLKHEFLTNNFKLRCEITV